MAVSDPRAPSPHWPLAARSVLWVIAAFYAYGALVHVLNMLCLTGFDWATAPRKWQVLDVVYLVIDLVVVVGLLARPAVGIAAFYGAAVSQIVLYTLLRDWVLDVPEPFRRSAEDIAYLDGLVVFHLVTCVCMSAAIWLGQRTSRAGAPRHHTPPPAQRG